MGNEIDPAAVDAAFRIDLLEIYSLILPITP
jgi:hypothetical protein